MRATALKGLLRYWYRALDPNHIINRISSEKRLFGSYDSRVGQSRVHIMLDNADPYYLSVSQTPEIEKSPMYQPHPRNLDWAYLSPEQSFTARILIQPSLKNDELERAWKGVLASMWLMMQVGGIGSQSRRGFGTVQIEKWEPVGDIPEKIKKIMIGFAQVADQSPETYKKQWEKEWHEIRRWFPVSPVKSNPTYTCISPRFATYFSKRTYQDPYEAWESAVAYFRQIKGDGRYAFGLPVKEGNKVVSTFIEKDSHFKKHVASPIRIRIPRLKPNQYLLQFSFLSAPYPEAINKDGRVSLDAQKHWRELEQILAENFFKVGD
jgi:CRISPR-associated protein Cmr1